MREARWLSQSEDRAWRGWMAMSELLHAQIARDLQADSGLSDSDFAVLVHLSEATAGRMRMTELAGALGWSKSRVSHQCSRMAARGLLSREGCPDDARSAYAVLTVCGRDEIQQAAPLHVESVRRHFIDLLDDADLRALAEISEGVIAHLQEAGLGGQEASLGGQEASLGGEEASWGREPEVAAPGALPPCPTQALRTNGAHPAPDHHSPARHLHPMP